MGHPPAPAKRLSISLNGSASATPIPGYMAYETAQTAKSSRVYEPILFPSGKTIQRPEIQITCPDVPLAQVYRACLLLAAAVAEWDYAGLMEGIGRISKSCGRPNDPGASLKGDFTPLSSNMSSSGRLADAYKRSRRTSPTRHKSRRD